MTFLRRGAEIYPPFSSFTSPFMLAATLSATRFAPEISAVSTL
jgi:hypothetical protein